MPEYFWAKDYPTHIEDYFTVVWLEQRGAGISYSSKIDPSTITAEQFVADDVENTKYLCKKFNKEKIYLMAHSWGTNIGIQLAKDYPELYYAYIPMAQIVNTDKSEKLAYDYMINYYIEIGDKKTLNKMLKAEFDTEAYSKIRDSIMHKSGIGSMRNMDSIVTGIILPVMRCKEYTLPERMTMFPGKFASQKAWRANRKKQPDKVIKIEDIKKIDIPIYFLHGKYDYTVNYDLTKKYYEELEAPIKKFYTFENSAHSPLYEEPGKAIDILVSDVIQK